MVLVLCPLFSTRCVGLRIKCSWVPFELNFRRRSRHDPICLRPFEFPFLRVIVNVVTSLFNPSAVVLCSPLARSFVSLRSFSFFNSPASCSFECGGRDDMEGQYSVLLWKYYPVPCTVCVRWTRVRRPGEFTSRESCDCVCWIVLPMVLSTVHCFPSLQCGRVREFESANSTMSREHWQLHNAVRIALPATSPMW